MGRPRIPKNIHIIKGSDKKNPARFIDRNPPEPNKGCPDAPTWLDKEGKKIFNQLVEITHNMNVLSIVDQYALALISDAFSDYLKASEAIQLNGITYKVTNREGQETIKQNPAVAMKADAWRRVQTGLGKFGLTPADREKINTPKPILKNSFASLDD